MNKYKPQEYWEKRYKKHKTVGFMDKTYYKYEEILRNISFDKAVKIKGGMKILDIGCGRGEWCFKFAKRSAEVVGIDINRLVIKTAKEINKKKKLNIQFYPIKVEDIKFKNDSFDIVYSITVLQHIINEKDYLKTLDKIVNVTKKNGKIAILEMIGENSNTFFYIKSRTKDYVVSQFKKRNCILIKEIGIPKIGYTAILKFNSILKKTMSALIGKNFNKMKEEDSRKYNFSSETKKNDSLTLRVYEILKKIILLFCFPFDFFIVLLRIKTKSSFRILVFKKLC